MKLYEYTPGFVHAKIFASDDVKAVVGTINLDYRSLYHTSSVRRISTAALPWATWSGISSGRWSSAAGDAGNHPP